MSSILKKSLFVLSLTLCTSACNESGGLSSSAIDPVGTEASGVAEASASKTCETSLNQEVVLLKNIAVSGSPSETTDLPPSDSPSECPADPSAPTPDASEPLVLPGCSESLIAKKLPASTIMAFLARPNEILDSSTWQTLVGMTGEQGPEISQGVTDMQAYMNALLQPLGTTTENIEHVAVGAFYNEVPAPEMPDGCTYGNKDDMCPDDDSDDFKDAHFMMGYSWSEPLAAESLTGFYQSLAAGPKPFTTSFQGKNQILTAKQVSQANGVTMIEVNYNEDDPSIACSDGSLDGCADVGCILTSDHILCTDNKQVEVLKAVETGEERSLQDANLVAKLGCSNLDGIWNYKQFEKGMTNPTTSESLVFSLLGTARLRSNFAKTDAAPWTILLELNDSPTNVLMSTEFKIQSGFIPKAIEILGKISMSDEDESAPSIPAPTPTP